ncbi:MAG: hypothetical protein COB01_10355 [Lutibacter sp.]|nr:MAG: hypothetical protein COB01_10355 [Lutibacter sp.]
MATIIMKNIKLTVLLLLITTVTFAQESPRKEAKGTIGEVAVTIDYGAPSVKGRTIWGGLEKYGKVWRAGANENTTITFDKEVKIGDTVVSAGKYGFFMIPNEHKNWTLILTTKNDAWGAFSYNKDEDVLRINIAPKFVDENREVLTYIVKEKGIKLAWGKLRIMMPVK